MAITIVCRDLDCDLVHHLEVSDAEAHAIASIDADAEASVELQGCRSRIDVRNDGTCDVYEPAPGGAAHWTADTEELVSAAMALLHSDESE